ncbi:transcriptional regulator, AsnC family [Deferribacter desulfuricans SSM1]|uniref:Transcriptional regulator, AsnC family n=1 Tax=Deferribacter desulfuricans (strain DSM 14783 / JCM 11476 / NBRC 101012 / SSM1) TaxID=639282 RepID=D3P9C8_DEFDS|nr:Lrp/AsnC family transcriptional regulator [Deferribacter desulfuricans]BAI81318.1 transcriptional regulator, AsnC family [Deferribacter desulfuricans SSM1]
MKHIDETDKKIINILIEDGRTSYADISKAVGMKPPSVIERIKKLEKEGIIEQYTTKINYKALGYDILAFIGISIDNAQHIEDFEVMLSNFDDDIVECHHVTGDFTMLLKVITRNTETLSKLIKKIRNINGVRQTNTILVFSTIMDRMRNI